MVKHPKLQVVNQTFVVEGEVNYYNVTSLFRQSLDVIMAHSNWIFDFSKLRANSAALALMIEWIKLARKHDKKIRFENIPSTLLSIAKVAGVDSILR